LSYRWMSSAVSCISPDGELWFPEFESVHFCPDMVNREASQDDVFFCHHSYNRTNAGSLLQGRSPSLPHGQHSIDTVPPASTSENHAERSSPCTVSNLERSDATVALRMTVSNSIKFPGTEPW
jgi:hypothetical protein